MYLHRSSSWQLLYSNQKICIGVKFLRSGRYFVCTFQQVDKSTWIKMWFFQCAKIFCATVCGFSVDPEANGSLTHKKINSTVVISQKLVWLLLLVIQLPNITHWISYKTNVDLMKMLVIWKIKRQLTVNEKNMQIPPHDYSISQKLAWLPHLAIL